MQTKNKPSMLRSIYGADYDLIHKKHYASLADEIMDNLHLIGVGGTSWSVVVAMLRHRYSPARVIPPAAHIAKEISRSYRHVLGIIASLKAADLLHVERVAGKVCYDLAPLIRKIKNLLRHKDPTPAAPLASRPAPRPRPAPVPTPAPEPDPLPPAALVEEVIEDDKDELDELLNAREDARNVRDKYQFGTGEYMRRNREFKRLDDLYHQALKRRRRKPRGGFLTLAVAALGGG